MSEKIEGVFVLQTESKIGTGHTEKTVAKSLYCIAKELEGNIVEFCYLGPDDKPMCDPETVPR